MKPVARPSLLSSSVGRAVAHARMIEEPRTAHTCSRAHTRGRAVESGLPGGAQCLPAILASSQSTSRSSGSSSMKCLLTWFGLGLGLGFGFGLGLGLGLRFRFGFGLGLGLRIG